MGKTRNLFKKIGAFHARMGGSGKDLQKQKRLRRKGKSTRTIQKRS